MIETGKVNKKLLDIEEYSDIDDSLLFFHKNNHNTNKELSCNNRKIIFSTNIFPHKKIYKGKVNKSLRKNLNKTKKDQRIEQSFNIKNQNEKEKIFIKKFQLENNFYRKDAYYKHFKVFLGKYIINKINILKNKCFPFYSKNNFSSPNYKYTGNPKEKDNFYFLSFTIRDLLIYGKDNIKQNRQYNNELIINFIETNANKTYDKDTYLLLIDFLNDSLENVITQFYDDNIAFQKIKLDIKCLHFDKFYKMETGFSLLEKYGFLYALKKYNILIPLVKSIS